MVKSGPNSVYQGYGQLMDPYCVAAPIVPRMPEVSFGDWLLSRIAFATRDGVANDPEMLLALYSVRLVFPGYLCSICLILGATWPKVPAVC